ncbi:MAG: ABC transporter permease [Paracoccaceae bacterium]
MSISTIQLVRQNLTRKFLRSFLLVLCIAIAFFVFGVLSSFQQGFEGAEATAERLVVTNKVGNNEGLPVSAWSQIAGIEGVAAATHITRLRAYFENQFNVIGANAVEPSSYLAVYSSTYNFSDEAVAGFQANRTGALVGRNLAEREGWTVGQRVTLTSFVHRNADGSNNWTFEVAGIFDGKEQAVDTSFMVVRYDFFNAALAEGADRVNLIGVLPVAGQDIATLSRRIDDAFANSAAETRTSTETEFMSAFLEQFADIALIVRMVVSVSFVTILMIVANTMIFAIRERTLEIGVLKVLGFSGSQIVRMILSETFVLFAVGLLIGIGLTAAAIPLLSGALVSVVPALHLTPGIAVTAIGLAAAFALLTGIVPAINALRLPIAAALRHR